MKELRTLIPSIYHEFIKLHNNEKFSILVPEVTENEKYYLDILYSLGTPTFTEFAEKAEISKPAATQIIKRLVGKDYVRKVQSKKDKRVYYIMINENIKKHFRKSDIYLDEIYKNCLSPLSDDEKDYFKKILLKINHSLRRS